MVTFVMQEVEPPLTLTTKEAEPLLCKSFSIKEKHESIQAIQAIISKGVSHCKACYTTGLPSFY
jgi:hypothetical protein